MRLSLVHSVALRKPSKCRPIPESFSINAPVAAQSCVPKRGNAVSIVHTPINTVRQSRRKSLMERMLELHKRSLHTLLEKEFMQPVLGRTPRIKDRVHGWEDR